MISPRPKKLPLILVNRSLPMKVLCEINDNDDFVLWMFLSVFTAWMEKVVSVNCVSVGGWSGGRRVGCGGQNGSLPLRGNSTVTVPEAESFQK